MGKCSTKRRFELASKALELFATHFTLYTTGVAVSLFQYSDTGGGS